VFIKRLKNALQFAKPDINLKLLMADSVISRFEGLMFRRDISDDQALLITKCNWVHSLFMRFSIDVIFLDASLTVIKIIHLKPYRLSMPVKNACSALEVKSGLCTHFNITYGDRFIIDE